MPLSAVSQSLEQHAWLLGDAEHEPCTTKNERYYRETRIAAALFKRRWRLSVRWRHQVHQRAVEQARLRQIDETVHHTARFRATVDTDITVLSNMPRRLPVLREEIAILRAFLGREIERILFGPEP